MTTQASASLLNQRAQSINLFEEAAARWGEGFDRLSHYEQSAIMYQMHLEKLKQSYDERNVCSPETASA